MKEKRIGLIGLAVVLACTITGCMSMMLGIAKSQFKDYGSYDSSVSADQLCDFRFIFVNVKSFDGKPVNWGSKANNMGHIKVPAGTHDIVFDWLMEETEETGSSYNSSSGTTTYTYETTTKSRKDISVSSVTFIAAHNYFLGGVQGPDGNIIFRFQDQTNMPNEFYGDVVAVAPKVDQTPTEFEGSWKGTDSVTFMFAGNTWEQSLPPHTATNEGDQEVKMKGTFETANGKLTLYMTDTYAAGKWVKMTAMKQAFIYTFSFENGNLIMELEGVLPKTVYLKQ
jgi:phage-related tail fiber protein